MSKDFETFLVCKKIVMGDPEIDERIREVCGEICQMTDVDQAACIRSRLAGKIPSGNLAIVEEVTRSRITSYKVCRNPGGRIDRNLSTFLFGGF